MRRTFLIMTAGLLAAGIAAGLFLTLGVGTVAAAGDCTVAAGELAVDGEEARALAEVNAFRQANGRGALQQSTALARAAAWMSRDMLGRDYAPGAEPEHPASDGRKIKDRQEDCGYPRQSFSQENIYEGSGGAAGAAAAVQWWKDSPYGHREAMLDARHRFAGIARACNGAGRCFWSLELGEQAGAGPDSDAGGADVTTRDHPVAVRCEMRGAGYDPQICRPGFTITVETQGVLRVRFVASPQGCSDFHVAFFHERVGGLPFNTMPTSGGDFLAPGAGSREVAFGVGGSPGQYRVTVLADGRPGGCNAGRLESWGGTLSVTTSGPPASTMPQEGRPPIATLPTVGLGASGEAVRTIQYLLRQHGADDVAVDGDFGPQTEGAVRAFQRTRGLDADGVVGPRTWPALFVTVQQGSEGDAVRAVQSQLAARGLDAAVDGDFGPQTDGAVRAFQQMRGLVVDGIVGPQTWAALVRGG